MQNKEFFTHLDKFFSKNKLQQVMDALLAFLDETDDNYNKLLMLLRRFSDVQNDNEQGIVDYQSQKLELNRISASLIKVISDVKATYNSSASIPVDKKLRVKAALGLRTLESENMTFHVHHKYHQPNRFDYFEDNGIILKAFTETEFILVMRLTNDSDYVYNVTNIYIETIEYKSTAYRKILRQNTPKGLKENVTCLFYPSKYFGGKVNVLESNQSFDIEPKKQEVLFLKLSETERISGYYLIQVKINGYLQNELKSFESDLIPLNIADSHSNKLTLNVMNHCDRLAAPILNLKKQTWDNLKVDERQYGMIWLGPSFADTLQNYEPDTWQIRAMLKPKHIITQDNLNNRHIELEFRSDTKTKKLYDFKEKVLEEERVSKTKLIGNMLVANGYGQFYD